MAHVVLCLPFQLPFPSPLLHFLLFRFPLLHFPSSTFLSSTFLSTFLSSTSSPPPSLLSPTPHSHLKHRGPPCSQPSDVSTGCGFHHFWMPIFFFSWPL